MKSFNFLGEHVNPEHLYKFGWMGTYATYHGKQQIPSPLPHAFAKGRYLRNYQEIFDKMST